MRKSVIIISVFVLLWLGAFAIERRCQHEQKFKDYKPEEVKISTFERKFRQGQRRNVAPIRIVFDYSNLVGVSERERQMVQDLMTHSADFLRKRINVEQSSLPIRVRQRCYQANVPQAHQSSGVNADLVIYVTAANEPNEGFLAWAISCQYDPLTVRPVVGQVNWNTATFDYRASEFQKFVDVSVHEITHVLVFSSSLYDKFRTSFGSTTARPLAQSTRNIMIRGKQKYAITTPKVLETARNYFNCPNVEGVDLEDDGGSGSQSSHWERGTLHNEMMGASTLPDESYSAFTLALLEDSGWYQVNYNYAEPLYFGKGAGCQYFQGNCAPTQGRREWCRVGQADACIHSLKGYGVCESDTYSNGCAFVEAYSNGRCEIPAASNNDIRGETYAVGSRCVTGNVINTRYQSKQDAPGCYKYTCEQGGQVIRFQLAGGQELVCRRAGERAVASGTYKGSILCPDPTNYCTPMFAGCLNDCSRKGYCNNGNCDCLAGWGGRDCSVQGGTTWVPGGSGSQVPSGSGTQVPSGSGSQYPSGSGTQVPSGTGTSRTTAEGYVVCSGYLCPRNSVCGNNRTCVCAAGFRGPKCSVRA